jgi:hypothetical protein
LRRSGIISRYVTRWRIEEFFRTLKQVYRLAGCQARSSTVWATHVYASALAYARNAIAGIDHYELQNLAHREMLGKYLSA